VRQPKSNRVWLRTEVASFLFMCVLIALLFIGLHLAAKAARSDGPTPTPTEYIQ
jgi:hypothetical protein